MNLNALKSLLAAKTGSEPKPAGEGFSCRCPAHDDQNASLSISTGNDGLLLKCHAGCTFADITAALGVKPAELFFNKGSTEGNGKSNLVATYPYYDAAGQLRYEVCRYDPKGFSQRRPDPARPDEWLRDLKGIDPIPYRLPELITAAKAGETVFIAEGEKDVAALVKNGFAATCNSGGALKWRANFAGHFIGAKAVRIIPDIAAAPPLIIGGLIGGAILLLLKALLSDDKPKPPETEPADKPEIPRKPAEAAGFRQIPAEMPAKPTAAPRPVLPRVVVPSPAIPAMPKIPAPVPMPAAVIVPKILPQAPPPPPIKKKVVAREDMATVFQRGARTLTRTAAVEALKKLGFCKTAAYAALTPDGRFSAWLAFSPDGIISWTDGRTDK